MSLLSPPAEVPVGAHIYRIGRLNAFQQFHVVRRLAPILTALGVSISEVAKVEEGLKQEGPDAMLRMMAPVMDVVSKMKDDDVDYIIKTCLSVVSRKEGPTAWAPMMRAQQLMFQDLDMSEMVRLTIEVVRENLSGFFSQLPGAA